MSTIGTSQPSRGLLAKWTRRFGVCAMLSCVPSCGVLETTSKDCLWARSIVLSDRALAAMVRSELEQVARHNRLVDKLCD